MQPWHAWPLSDLIAYLKTDPGAGLEPAQARQRLLIYGPNQLPAGRKAGALKLFLAQFEDFMVLVLLVAAVLSLFLGEWYDAITILAIVVLNAVLGFFQEYRAERSLSALRRLTAPRARCRRAFLEVDVPAAEVVPGDLLLLAAGDRVAADARLVRAWDLACDESALTGESVPVAKEVCELPAETALAERRNLVYAGTLVTRGRAEAVVVATGLGTETGQIARLLGKHKEESTPLEQRLDHLGRVLVAGCIAICALVVALGLRRGGSALELIMAGISLAVAAIPEGLPAVVTLALAVGVQRMVRRRAILRKLPAVETLGCATVICADKTGTLTENRMTVREIRAADGKLALTIGALCNDATLKREGIGIGSLWRGRRAGGEKWSAAGDPTEAALLVAAAEAGLVRGFLEQAHPRLGEIPFDSYRKLMSTAHRWGKGVRLLVKGAPDVVLERCQNYDDGRGAVPLDARAKAEWLGQNEELAGRALRVLAVAYRDLPAWGGELHPNLESELTLVGLVGLSDPLRPGVREAIARCRRAGIKTVMITGDHPTTAVAVAKELGLPWEQGVATGAELESWSQRELEKWAGRIAVYARVSPRHKLRIVRALKRRGHVVAMTGDGINDAPAIKEADIGVAMGQAGTDIAKEASAMIIEDDNFTTIVAAVEEGRAVYDNIRKFIRYLLTCNMGEVMTMLLAAVFGLPLPLLPIQILWVNLVTDGLPALALGFDPPAPDIMERPPRHPGESILSRGLAGKVLARGLGIGLLTVGVFVLAARAGGGIERARTMAFTVLVLQQLFYVFECRSETKPIFAVGLFSNPYLLVAAALSLAMQLGALYHPFLKVVFHTEAPAGREWALLLLVAGGPFLWQGVLWASGWTEKGELDIMGNNT
ncbi:MAG: P-type Ca2+ transporter type [Bacillota bacterium]|nr:P-type Ca2+ transporter type [Bacillota bacterium]